MSTSSNQSWIRSVCSSWTWRWPKCECLLVILTWFTGVLGACFRVVCRFGRVSTPILPIVNPRSQSPKRRCARWWNWCRKSKCQCTSPTCRRYRRWKKDWRKFPARCFRRMRNLRWPVWEPDQNSLFTRVIKASRLDGFKMSLKEGMHFAARIMYVVTYKIFTGVAIYLIFVSSVKIRTHPMMYKNVGKVPMEDTPFPGIDVCPSQLFPRALLLEAKLLYDSAEIDGYAIDSFGGNWTFTQAAKLYYYVYKRCNAAAGHSQFAGLSTSYEFLEKGSMFEDRNNFTFQDHPRDNDYQNVLELVKQHQGTLNCSKILQACRWGPDGMRNCSEIFGVEPTETGDCCRLKPRPFSRSLEPQKAEERQRWNIDEHSFTGNSGEEAAKEMEDSPWFQKVAGTEFGLTFILIAETKNMACPINEGAGFMVYVHSPLNSPNAKTNGIPIPPNHDVYINVNADITISDQDIFASPVESRQCYSQKEANFLKSSDYTEGNCRMECRALLFQSRCKCQPFGTTTGNNETLCGPQQEKCAQKLETELHARGYSQMCMNLSIPMNCYHGCTEVVYTTVVYSSPYFREPGFVEQLKLREGQYASTVRIFFGSDTFAAKLRQQQYDFWEYVGIVGGLLGMLIGFDFMTLVHLIYAFGIWMKGLWLNRKKSRVAKAIFNMTNHVDLIKALSTQTPSNPIIATGSAGPSAGTSGQPQTWPGDITKLEARLKSIYIIQKGSKNERISLDDSTDLDQTADLIDPVEVVIPTRQKIRNALFEHMPKTVAFKNIFVIPKRVAPVDLVDHIELLDVEPAEPSDMEIIDRNLIPPVIQADPTETAFVDPTDIEPADPIEINTVAPTDLEPTIELVDPELIEQTELIGAIEQTELIGAIEQTELIGAIEQTELIGAIEQTELIGAIEQTELIGAIEQTELIGAIEQTELIDPGTISPIASTGLEPVAPADSIESLEPTNTNPVDPAKTRSRIPLYKHKEYLKNGQVVIVLNPKKRSSYSEKNMSSSEEEL